VGKIEKSIKIRALPEKVWEMLAFDMSPEWMGDLTVKAEYTSVVIDSEDKFKVGATDHVSTHSNLEGNLEIIESVKYKKMKSRLTSKTMTSIGTYYLKSTEIGTAVTYLMDYKFHSTLWKILGILMFNRMIKKDYDKALNKLKNILEK